MKNLTIPNLLTLLRLVLAPFAIRAIAAGRFREALAMLAIAGITDGLDGFLARRFGWTSQLGAYLDPIADKVLLSGSYLALGWAGIVPWWLVAVVFGRDVMILAMVAAAFLWTRIRQFPPSVWGKLSTSIQVITGVTLIVSQAYPMLGIPVKPFLWAVALAAVWSGVDYLRRGAIMLRSERHSGPIDDTAIRA